MGIPLSLHLRMKRHLERGDIKVKAFVAAALREKLDRDKAGRAKA